MPKSKTVPALLVGVSMLSVAACVVALSVVYWVESNTDNDDNYTGLFLKESENREIAKMLLFNVCADFSRLAKFGEALTYHLREQVFCDFGGEN